MARQWKAVSLNQWEFYHKYEGFQKDDGFRGLLVELMEKKVLVKVVFFYPFVFSGTFTIHRTTGEEGGHFFNFPLPLPPVSQTLRHQPGHYCRELTSAQRQRSDFKHKLLNTKLCILKCGGGGSAAGCKGAFRGVLEMVLEEILLGLQSSFL